jgi:hypothetical protein
MYCMEKAKLEGQERARTVSERTLEVGSIRVQLQEHSC